MDFFELTQAVIALSKEVGAFIVEEARTFDKAIHAEFKGKNNLVSYVDKEAERRIVEALTRIFATAGMIAEEGTGTQQNIGYNWIVDPLDGTTNFVHNIPLYTISIALVHTNEKNQHTPVVGVVYEPNRKECFYAWQGGGTWLQNQYGTNQIYVATTEKMENSLVATGFPWHHNNMAKYLELLHKVLNKSYGFRRMGSAALDLAYVACGRFEAFYEQNLNAWDVAAGALLVAEAGGKVSDFRGDNDFIFGKQIIASNSKIHDEITAIAKEYLSD